MRFSSRLNMLVFRVFQLKFRPIGLEHLKRSQFRFVIVLKVRLYLKQFELLMMWWCFQRRFLMDTKSFVHHPWSIGKKMKSREKYFDFCFVIRRSLNDRKLSWKVPYIFDGSGTLTATIKILPTSTDDQAISTTRSSTTPAIVHVQFSGENALFSSIDFEFACRGYRISLLKKKISSGEFFSFGFLFWFLIKII